MSTRSTFGTIKRIVAILIAIGIVLAAGIIVGQAPAIFGVEEDPTASITVEDQETNGTVVEIDEVTLSDGGFVVVSEDGETLVVSDYLESGTHENATIESEEEELTGKLTATVHQDTTDDETYAYEETDGEEDRPYLSDGFPVSDTATVTTAELDDPLDESFAVESLDVRPTVTTNETLQVIAEIENPTEFDGPQSVEFRLDGRVLEQRALDLSAGESTEVTFEFDTSDTTPGERTIGVYTDGDGELETIEFEFHTDPSVAITETSEDEVTADVATPTDGFVAIVDDENATDEDGLDVDLEDVVGTSEELEPGEHENVTIGFDENATVDESDELAAVLYEGDPDDLEAASPVEHDDEPVVTTFTIADGQQLEAGETDLEVENGADDDGDDGDE
ncbi:DUF7282 domain-containing protein [Natronobacterium texcoconense]|uniref:DUF7282 domain-containing protein n=1 Tax=Natronobacterium texcoconense TaxID=1095778 RepID=A0A1H1I2L2_NATTX|nr:hypothetical protein [Natronobacterium texcoconense]SDR31961.1 hypothetical protein SAMN04489842_3267 [Natronobacterium texcoconense]